MKDREKLKHLLHHWQEHNHEHAATYKEWAERASSSGHGELSKILGRLYEETRRLDILFEEALKAL